MIVELRGGPRDGAVTEVDGWTRAIEIRTPPVPSLLIADPLKPATVNEGDGAPLAGTYLPEPGQVPDPYGVVPMRWSWRPVPVVAS